MMKRMMLCLAVASIGLVANAQTNSNHLMFGVGALYEKGLDATIAYEHGSKYHNAWEYFATGYLQYDDDPNRGRNHHGNVRIGASGGSDLHDFVGGVHLGYEHTYALKGGWELFFQVKEDVIIGSGLSWRTGGSVGLKLPL